MQTLDPSGDPGRREAQEPNSSPRQELKLVCGGLRCAYLSDKHTPITNVARSPRRQQEHMCSFEARDVASWTMRPAAGAEVR